MNELLKLERSDGAPSIFWKARQLTVVTGLFAGALMFASSSAFAAAATNLSVAASPVPSEVSVSRGTTLTTYTAYTVSIKNTGNSTANKVVYEASAQALSNAVPVIPETGDVPTQSAAPAVESTNSSCKVAAGKFTCSLGQMAKNDTRTFLVIFEAPQAFDGTTTPGTPNKQLKLKSVLSFCSNTTCGSTNNAVVVVDPAYTKLITADDPAIASGVKSVIPSFGGSFFTGGVAAATPTDPWKTTVVVPSLTASNPPQSFVTTSIEETTTLDTRVSCTSGQCWDTNLLIPDLHFPKSSGAKLTITLLKDASIVGSGTIKNATVWYIDSSNDIRALDSCTDTGGPSPGVPCIASRKEYAKTGTAKNPVPEGFAGDWEFVIYALDNGRYEI